MASSEFFFFCLFELLIGFFFLVNLAGYVEIINTSDVVECKRLCIPFDVNEMGMRKCLFWASFSHYT